MEPREPGGLEIAATKKLEQKATLGIVPSQTGTGKYVVDRSASNPTSSCPDFEQWLAPSKHVYAVEFVLRRETSAPNGTATETVRVTYRQEWSAYNAAQVHEKERVAVLLHDLCAGIDNPPQGRGRPRLPISDSIFCAVVKVYSGSSGRRAMTDLRDLAAKGYIERAPHYNSVFNALENPELTLFLHALIERSAMPLAVLETDFAVDASGFSTGDYMR